jgi:4-hydroxyphenylacetate decarboxylase small subunit
VSAPVHVHCRNYAPIDVVKGICHATKKTVHADDEACPSFDRLPRCVECKLYSASEEEQYVGVCEATEDKPMTYPDLAAVSCEWFEWKTA